jgi:nicotinate-nucleotide pyrophosphorylase (carboxylating)
MGRRSAFTLSPNTPNLSPAISAVAAEFVTTPMTRHNLIPVDALCQRITWRDLDLRALGRLVRAARAEDMFGTGLRRRPRHRGDVTTRAVVGRQRGRAELRARRELVVCGLPLIPIVLAAYGRNARCDALVEDGTTVPAGTVLARLEGPARTLLEAERVLLNFVQRVSGIATHTATHVRALGDSPTRLLDTRKTTPGHRVLEKYAVACGGGWNHRIGLFDRVLIKDNHLAAAGATRGDRLAAAVRQARLRVPDLFIEVEVDGLDQLPPVLDAGADIVLLDNFTVPQLRRAVAVCAGRTRTEASGGVTLKTLPRLAGLGLDFISSGALVHQSTWIDIGLDWL